MVHLTDEKVKRVTSDVTRGRSRCVHYRPEAGNGVHDGDFQRHRSWLQDKTSRGQQTHQGTVVCPQSKCYDNPVMTSEKLDPFPSV